MLTELGGLEESNDEREMCGLIASLGNKVQDQMAPEYAVSGVKERVVDLL